MTGIYLWLDSYDDIYSDFDSRHYLTRRISEDFLAELLIELKNSPHTQNMILSLPAQQREESTEKIIASSLHNFFTKHYKLQTHLRRQKLYKGLSFLIFGVMLMLLNSWIIYRLNETFLIICLKIILEPGSWFLLWAGLDFLFYNFSGLKKNENFYKTLSEMNIYFQSSSEGILPNKSNLMP